MSINKIMEANSIGELLSAIDDFCLDTTVCDNDSECLGLKEEVLASGKDILSILASYLCVCEDGDEVINALYEFSANCKSFVECKDESAEKITKEEFEAVLEECEEKSEVRTCIEYVNELKIAEVNATNRFPQHLVRIKSETVNVFLPCINREEDKTKYISNIIGRALFFVVNKYVKKEDIRYMMNKLIPECRDSDRGTMDLFIDYFCDVVKYKERKPGIYTEFDSHMKQVIVLQFYKNIVESYKRAVYETDFVRENVSEWDCKKRLPYEKRKCEKCKYVDDCFGESSSNFEERFIEDMALSSGYPSVDAFWDSMI